MDNIVRGGNWYFDALNAWRVLDEVQLPNIAFAADTFTPAAHMMSVEMLEEMEALTATIKLKNNDPQVRGLCGRAPGNYITAYYYENLVSYREGGKKGRIIVMKGQLKTVEQDPVRGLKAAGVSYIFSSIVHYKDMFEGRIVHRFDFFEGPGATIVNGDAPYADMATNLAIGGGTIL